MQVLSDNSIAAVVVALLLAFIKPVLWALQRALIRRIDQAWPDEGEHEDRVKLTVDTVNESTIWPRSTVENLVRKHKSISPPKGAGE